MSKFGLNFATSMAAGAVAGGLREIGIGSDFVGSVARGIVNTSSKMLQVSDNGSWGWNDDFGMDTIQDGAATTFGNYIGKKVASGMQNGFTEGYGGKNNAYSGALLNNFSTHFARKLFGSDEKFSWEALTDVDVLGLAMDGYGFKDATAEKRARLAKEKEKEFDKKTEGMSEKDKRDYAEKERRKNDPMSHDPFQKVDDLISGLFGGIGRILGQTGRSVIDGIAEGATTASNWMGDTLDNAFAPKFEKMELLEEEQMHLGREEIKLVMPKPTLIYTNDVKETTETEELEKLKTNTGAGKLLRSLADHYSNKELVQTIINLNAKGDKDFKIEDVEKMIESGQRLLVPKGIEISSKFMSKYYGSKKTKSPAKQVIEKVTQPATKENKSGGFFGWVKDKWSSVKNYFGGEKNYAKKAIAPSSSLDGTVRITQGYPNYTNDNKHKGLDIMCGVNSSDNIVATEPSIVYDTKIGQKGVSGKSSQVILQGKNSGYFLINKHTGKHKVKKGQHVSAGTILGSPDMTGKTDSALHP